MPFTRPRMWLEPREVPTFVRYSGNTILKMGQGYSIIQTLKEASPGAVFQIDCLDKVYAHFFIRQIAALDVLVEGEHDQGYTIIVRKLLL